MLKRYADLIFNVTHLVTAQKDNPCYHKCGQIHLKYAIIIKQMIVIWIKPISSVNCHQSTVLEFIFRWLVTAYRI